MATTEEIKGIPEVKETQVLPQTPTPTAVDANQGAVQAAKNRLLLPNREKASDRKISIVKEIQNIPETPRLCDQFEGTKEMVPVSEDCRLYVESEGEGEPVILINGGPGGTHHYFHPHFSQLKDSAKVIYYDQRGCGLSDRVAGEGYSIDQAVNDLEDLRIKLGIDRWTVLGHSYGGLLAQCYTKKYPQSVKGLVLTCASPGVETSESDRSNDFISKEEGTRIGEIYRKASEGLPLNKAIYNAWLNGYWKRQNYYKPSEKEMAQVALYEWDHDPEFRDAVGQEANDCNLEGAFKDSKIPTMIIEGRQDMTWDTDKPEKLLANHPNAKMLMFEESAHDPFKDEPEKFFGELKSFLKTLS